MSDPSTVELVEGLAVGYGKYELVRLIGRGGMGQVWLAKHITLGGEFAIKFLDRHSEDPAAMARFQFEAQIAARIAKRTRHIVTVSDHGEEWGFAYLVMEFVDGETLETAIHRTGKADLALVSEVVAQVAKALAGAHSEGVFHRDLKPANVLLARDEDGNLLAKILDFGIAKTSRSHRLPHKTGLTTDEGVVLGTPSYMSPEQARGLASLDHRCDLWALSTIAYEALTGRLPYDGETTADLMVNICTADYVPVCQLRPDLPGEAEAFFARAFAPRLQNRFQDAGELAAWFAAIAPKAQLSPPPAPVVEEVGTIDSQIAVAHTQRTARVAPKLVGLVVLGAATFALAVIGFSRLSVRRSEPAAETTREVASQPSSAVSIAKSMSVDVAQLPPIEASPSSIAPKPKIAANPPIPKTAAVPSASSKASAAPTTTPTVTAPSAPQKPIDKGEIL